MRKDISLQDVLNLVPDAIWRKWGNKLDFVENEYPYDPSKHYSYKLMDTICERINYSNRNKDDHPRFKPLEKKELNKVDKDLGRLYDLYSDPLQYEENNKKIWEDKLKGEHQYFKEKSNL